MRVLVIGEPCIDVIHKADGKVYNEHGGITYSVVAGALLDDGVEVIPVIGLHHDDAPYFKHLLEQLKPANLSGIYSVDLPTRRVNLFYEDENDRWECSTQPIQPTPFEKIAPFLPAEGIHLNLISGSDIELKTLQRIRTTAPEAHIHLDLHNIVMQLLPDSKRVRAPRKDYLEWCKYADTVQLNEDEANVIDASTNERHTLAEKVLETGAKALIVTLAEKGFILFEKSEGKIIELFFPPKETNVVDPTGSGDVLGAAFLHAIVRGKDYRDAAELGAEMAAKKVAVAGPGGLLRWRNTIDHA
ncbi:MAG: carbohydrate kinase family protein [Bacteroidetes bacterium]|nr:carbohydrate kinase family protein [Bacteroidota bacterium]